MFTEPLRILSAKKSESANIRAKNRVFLREIEGCGEIGFAKPANSRGKRHSSLWKNRPRTRICGENEAFRFHEKRRIAGLHFMLAPGDASATQHAGEPPSGVAMKAVGR
jgi:hypothetical protein